MRNWIARAGAAALAFAAPPALAAPLPPAVRDMIAAAAGDPEALKAVVKAAKQALPQSIAEIDAEAAAAAGAAAVPGRKPAKPADRGVFEGWTGKVELGGSISSGNTNDQGFAAALGFDKLTPRWGHDLNLSVDYKREDHQTTKDRYFGAYSINYNLTPRLYAVGVLWGERDRFAGYNYRFSESLGLGYRLFDGQKLKLRLEAGPAWRQAEYRTSGYDSTFAARGAGYLTWQVWPRLEFSQSLVTYLDPQNSTVLASTALTTRLQGRLSARASYELRQEEDPPDDRAHTDTTSRLTLLYSF